MQVLMKIAEKQRKSRAGFVQLMNYISRDSFKTFGVGINDDKDIAIRQCLINKDLHKKNRDGKDRFTYHEIFSFGVDVGVEKVIDIMLEFCEVNFYEKDFNSFFAIHTDTDNIHCHVVADNVNFNTGDMIHSVTQKQFDSMSQKKKDKAETFVYEHQRKLFEDICIKHGLDISMEERYEYMHEQKQKEGRKWLTKEQYRAKQDKTAWTNEIKDKLEQIYKNEDVNEDNIKDIAVKYGLEVTRHNKTNKTITFALIDEQGKRTNQKLKLVQELNKKKRKTQDEVTEDTVKLGIKLDTLEIQEKELKKDSDENIFIYDNFFGGKKKEIEKEETREDIYAFFEREKEKLRLKKEKEAEAKAKEVKEDIKPVEEVKEDIKPVEEVKEDIRPVNTYIVEDSKPSDFELEKEYKTEKEILDNFYKDQEDKKKEQDSKAKALEQEIKDIEKAEIDKITQADEVLRRLNIDEQERQTEAKAKKEAEEKAKHKQVDIDSLLEKVDSYKLIEKYDLFDALPQFKVTLNEESILFDSETGEGDIELAKNLIRAKGDEYRDNIDLKDIRTWEDVKMITTYYYDSYDELNRYNDYNEYSRDTIKQFLEENTSIAEELAYIYNMQDSNSKTYEDTKVASVEKQVETKKEQEEEEKQDLKSKEKEIEVAEVIESKQELTNSESVITNSEPTITESKEEITNSKQEEQQEEKQDLKSKQVDIDSLIEKIDSYKLVKEYNLFDTLPPFQVIGEDLIYDSSSGEGDFELAKSLIIDVKGKEYWDNMNVKDIKQWEETGVFTVGYIDDNDNFKYNGYEDYSKDTIKQFLVENTEVAEELAKQYMPTDSKKKEQDSKDYEVEKKKDREIDFN